MSLDPKYIPAFAFQEQLVNKETGLPLDAGVVTFYKDQARTELKDVFTIGGVPPDYTYTALPNPLILSSVGTFVDENGNDIIPYFYPYDSEGKVELYYVTVYSKDAEFQFDREGQPNVFDDSTDSLLTATNYIPNGQFLYHINRSDDEPITTGLYLGYGGYEFQRSSLASTVYISYERIGSYVENPTQSPRYFLKVRCTVPDITETLMFHQFNFLDVNKFASETQQYTFTFTAKSNSGSSIPVEIQIKKYFGSGGTPSPTEYIHVASFNIDPVLGTYSANIIFGTNEGKSIGTNDDDDVSILIRMPTANAFDISITDVSLLVGNVNVTEFPLETSEQMNYRSIAALLERPKADNLYLPLILSPNGLTYDTTVVGTVYMSTSENGYKGIYEELNGIAALCDGNTKYIHNFDLNLQRRVDLYTECGIPYYRLSNTLLYTVPTTGETIHLFGGGYQYVNSWVGGSPNELVIGLNEIGAVTDSTAGTTPFTVITGIGEIFHTTFVTVTDASTINSGMWFDFYTNVGSNDRNIVFFVKDNVLVTTGIPTNGTQYIAAYINSGATANDVKFATIYAINTQAFGVPDLRGFFVRGWNAGATYAGLPAVPHDRFADERNLLVDTDPLTQQFPFTPILGDVIGTYQFDQNYIPTLDLEKSMNMALNYYIKY